jgi:hypothetical protein
MSSTGNVHIMQAHYYYYYYYYYYYLNNVAH